jgi:hypothetical protein
MGKKKVHCGTHGESEESYVCVHLTGESAGLGFNGDKPTRRKPYPDAWCDNCEIIRAAHDGWTDEAQELCKITLLCSGCYERARIRNTRPTVTLDDLAGLRWKCGSCEEWHTGPMLDIGFDSPGYWSDDNDAAARWSVLPSGELDSSAATFLDSDYCACDGNYFVRGLIHLPILGAAETFRWGVWGSLSRENFEKLIKADYSGENLEGTKMFSWLSNRIPEYPDKRNLKMYAHIQEPGLRPNFFLERCDHPLSQEYHLGISPERVREIMFRNLPAQGA